MTRGEEWTRSAQLASTGEFTTVSWVSTGKVQEALIHCTVIQLGEGIPAAGGFPSFVKSQCDIPIVFDNGDIMFWHGVETLDIINMHPPLGGSKMPYAIEGGRGEWVGATGQGVIDCEFFTPPRCTAEGVVCKSPHLPEIVKLLNPPTLSKAGKKETFN